MDRLIDRVAIVTGAGQGIGRGIAHRFAKEGARVVVAEWKAHRGERVVAELEKLGAEAIAVPTDVSDRAQLEALVEKTVDTFGCVDILVNNAQSFTPNVPFHEKTDEMWSVSLLTGPLATFWAMCAVYPVMRNGGGGRIINFASLNGEVDPLDHEDRRPGVGARRNPRQRDRTWRRFAGLPGLGETPTGDGRGAGAQEADPARG